ncbi:glycine zipper domain-containing protein, partial [Pseudoalteromonas sp. S1691]|uniref:YMGG-like glycine zipper-containing protein n=1 Tax=Pseudoalteromonas sp. S1691 TaxID=579513 RepID=UPI001DBB272D
MTLTKSLISVTVVAVLLSACELNNSWKGAAICSGAGGVLGKATGIHKDKRIFIGSAIGAQAGAAVGPNMDTQEDAIPDELAGAAES